MTFFLKKSKREDEISMKKATKRKAYSLVFSLLLSGALLLFLFSRIEFSRLQEVFTSLFWPFLVAYMSVAFLASLLRSWRYQLLLKPRPTRTGDFLLVTLIRNLFVDLFPARLGSLSYVYLTNRSLSYPFQAAASSFLLAFLFDFLTLTPFLVVAILWVGLGQTPLASSYLIIISVIFLGLVFLIFSQLEKILQRLTTFLARIETSPKIKAREKLHHLLLTVRQKIDATTDELQRTKKNQNSWWIFLLSLIIRALKYFSLYFLLSALLHPQLFSSFSLDFWTTILAITGAELTSFLPIKGIAGFGTWEAAWALSLNLMGYEAELAIISGLGLHLITNLYEYSLGILAMIILALRPQKPARLNLKGDHPNHDA